MRAIELFADRPELTLLELAHREAAPPLRAAVGRLENITSADSTLLDILEAHGVTPGHAEAVLLGRRHDKPSTPLDTAKFWNPTVEKIVSALPSADAEAGRAGREPAAFYDALAAMDGAPAAGRP
jgi:hypothetical protein